MSARWIAMIVLAFGIAVAAVDSRAEGEPAAHDGEGRELFVASCSSCHSLDYMEMHARFGTRALWEAEVTKMRNAYKAPLSDDEGKAIAEYLTRAYGPASSPASASR